jgi:hypothetical protein
MENEKIPNCNLCEWFGFTKCKAQGYAEAALCYNSDSCKKLYQLRSKN